MRPADPRALLDDPGHCFSSDEGRTWTKPAVLSGVFSVQPSLAVMPDGLVVLSGRRPGLFFWLNPEGTAATWHKLDVLANHNAHRPEEPIQGEGNTSSYTEVILLDDHHLLCIYDRIPFGWNPIPPASPQTKSVWVVRVALTRRRSFVYQSFNAACLGSGDEG